MKIDDIECNRLYMRAKTRISNEAASVTRVFVRMASKNGECVGH